MRTSFTRDHDAIAIDPYHYRTVVRQHYDIYKQLNERNGGWLTPFSLASRVTITVFQGRDGGGGLHEEIF